MKLSEIRKLGEQLSQWGSTDRQSEVIRLLREMGKDPSKLYQELEMESRFADTHRDTSTNNGGVQLHSHTFSEVIYCCNTCGVEYLVGTERYRVQKGDVLLISPGVSHRPILPENLPEPYSRYVLWLSPELLGALQSMESVAEVSEDRQTNLIRTAGTRWDCLEEWFRLGVMEAEKREPFWEMAVLGNTIRILTLLCRALQDGTAETLRAEKPELVDRVVAYIEQNLASRLTLADIARQFYVSESTVSQLFRKKMDVSFYRFVTQRRLIAAKILIGRGEQLEDVARQVGFGEYSSFYRAFRQEYGISPRQFRKMQTGEEPKVLA